MFAFRLFRASPCSSSACIPPLRANRLPYRQFHSHRRFDQQHQRFPGQSYSRFQRTSNLFHRWVARPTFYYEVAGVGGAIGGFYLYNLETVPVSGRKRFNIISPKYEQELGDQQYQQILQQYRGQILSEWDPRVRMVQRVMDRLIPVSGIADCDWQIHVVNEKEKNAFVIPGGKVFVFTDILPVCQNDDGLATVLGHEIAHNVAHHAAEKMSSYFVASALIYALAFFFDISGNLSNVLIQLGAALPNSRKQETEADFIGLRMMAQACYDPDEAVRFWERMEKSAQFEPPQLLSTHPSSHNRVHKLQEWLPEARNQREMSECSATAHLADDFSRRIGQLRW